MCDPPPPPPAAIISDFTQASIEMLRAFRSFANILVETVQEMKVAEFWRDLEALSAKASPPHDWRLDQPASLFRFPRAMRLGPRPGTAPLRRIRQRPARSPPRYGWPVYTPGDACSVRRGSA